MELSFTTRNEKQLEAAKYWIDPTSEEILYGGAKGGGKSYLGASLIFGDALIYPGTHFFIARKELIDLRQFTIPTIHEVFKNWKLDIKQYAAYNGQDHCYNLHNGSKVHLLACKEEPSDPFFERFGSMQMTRGWLEEAGEIPEAAKANLWLSIGRWKNAEYKLKKKLLITANPKKGWMKREFVDPFKAELLPPPRKYIQAFAGDNPYLLADYLESLRNEKDKVRRERLWEGNWDYDEDSDSLITYDALTDAFSNTIYSDGDKYLIVDVARLGTDSIVHSFWDGLEEYKIMKYQKQTIDRTIQGIRDAAAAEHIPFSHILIDEGGVGGGVVDHLFGVRGFNGASTPLPSSSEIRERAAKAAHFLVPKTIFGNLRAQCGWKLAELINEHNIAFMVPEYRDEIIGDVTALLKDADPAGESKKHLRDKDKAKQELGHSPDVGDVHIMRAYFEILEDAGVGPATDIKRAAAMDEQKTKLSSNRKKKGIASSK